MDTDSNRGPGSGRRWEIPIPPEHHVHRDGFIVTEPPLRTRTAMSSDGGPTRDAVEP